MQDTLRLMERNEKCAPGRLRSLQSFQIMLLRKALLCFPMAKRVVYSTCSIYTEENEMVIDEILNIMGDAYKLVPVKSALNGNWVNLSSSEFQCKDNCLYAKPEFDMCNGFFVAILERNPDVPLPEYKRKFAKTSTISNDEPNPSSGNEGKKRKREKSKTRSVCDFPDIDNLDECVDSDDGDVKVGAGESKKKRRKRSKKNKSKPEEEVKNCELAEAQCNSVSISTDDNAPPPTKEKKKKKKHKEP